MAWLDEYLSDNPLPEETTAPETNTNPDTVETPSADTSRIIIQQETATAVTEEAARVEREALQEEVETPTTPTESLQSPEFPPELQEAFNALIESHGAQIESMMSGLEDDILASESLSETELWESIASLSLTWEFATLGNTIKNEAQRILWLAEWEKIILNIPELNPAPLEFPTKKDALLYINFHALIVQASSDFVVQNVSAEDATNYLGWGITALSLLSAYMLFCIAGSTRRGIRLALFKTLGLWQKITATTNPTTTGPDAARYTAEFTEYTARQEGLQLMREVFKGNDEILSQLTWDNYLMLIDARLDNARAGRITESSFWRRLWNIEAQRGVGWRAFDILLKSYYFNSESSLLERLREGARVRQEVINFASGPQWQQIKDNLSSFLEISHDIPNDVELLRRDDLNNTYQSIIDGKLNYIYEQGMDKDAGISEVKKRLISALLGTTISDADVARILGDGTLANPGEGARLEAMDVQKTPILDEKLYTNTIRDRFLNNQLTWSTYSISGVSWELRTFIGSIGNTAWKHRYNFKTASLIMEYILEWMDDQAAISRAFWEPWVRVDADIQTPSYLSQKETTLRTQLEKDLTTRVGSIANETELRNFERDIMNHIKDGSWKYFSGYEALWANLQSLLNERVALWYPKASVEVTLDALERKRLETYDMMSRSLVLDPSIDDADIPDMIRTIAWAWDEATLDIIQNDILDFLKDGWHLDVTRTAIPNWVEIRTLPRGFSFTPDQEAAVREIGDISARWTYDSALDIVALFKRAAGR